MVVERTQVCKKNKDEAPQKARVLPTTPLFASTQCLLVPHLSVLVVKGSQRARRGRESLSNDHGNNARPSCWVTCHMTLSAARTRDYLFLQQSSDAAERAHCHFRVGVVGLWWIYPTKHLILLGVRAYHDPNIPPSTEECVLVSTFWRPRTSPR